MAIEERIELYEVLIRFNPDSTIKGAHERKQEVLWDTDKNELKMATPLRATPIDPSTVADLIGAESVANINLIQELSQTQAKHDDVVAELHSNVMKAQRGAMTLKGKAESLLKTAGDEKTELAEKLGKTQAKFKNACKKQDELKSKLETADAEIQMLRQKVINCNELELEVEGLRKQLASLQNEG